jgi:hypothetical protein
MNPGITPRHGIHPEYEQQGDFDGDKNRDIQEERILSGDVPVKPHQKRQVERQGKQKNIPKQKYKQTDIPCSFKMHSHNNATPVIIV